MTVSSATASETFACNSVTTIFTCPFRVLAATDMQVFLVVVATGVTTRLANVADYAVTDVGLANAVVTTVATYSNAYQIRCKRATARLQETDYRDNDPFPAESHETALDRLAMIAQEDEESIGRTIRVPDGESLLELASAAARASTLLGFDSTGQLVYSIPASGSAAALTLLLAGVGNNAEGARMIGYSAALAYAGGLGQFLNYVYARTADEIAAGVTPTNYAYTPGDPRRYGGAADNATNNQAALANAVALSRECALMYGAWRLGTGNLAPTQGQTIKGQGREKTYVRTTHASNPVFLGATAFVTYQDMTIDRSGAIDGQGISHAGNFSGAGPLEGFSAKRVNCNGHASGIKLRDFVLASVDECYLQNGTTGLDVDKLGATFNTMLTVRKSWLRGNTDYNANVAGVISSDWNQVAFEGSGAATNVGLRISGGSVHHVTNCWWESQDLAGEFIDCNDVSLNSGYVDGTGLVTRAFYVYGTTTAVFDGAWGTANLAVTFATADNGATIIVRSKGLMGLTFAAINGGKVLFDVPIEASVVYDPGSLADGAGVTSTVTVTGAALGDHATVAFSLALQGITATAWVSAADTVSFRLQNESGGVLDLASLTVYARVMKHALTS